MEKKIVIVGAGYAGILAAKKLSKLIKEREGISIDIIDKNPFSTMLTELHEVAAGRVEEDSIRINLRKVFAGRRVNVICDTVNSVDFENRTLSGVKETYNYDYLVLAAGSKPTYFGIPGVEEFSYKLWSYEDAVRLREHIEGCFRKAAAADTEEQKRLLSFFIAGAGFTGVEMAGELAEYVPILCERYGIDRRLVTVCIVDALKRAVPILPEALSRKVEKRLEKMGVTVMLDTGVAGVGSDFIELKSGGESSRHNTDTVVWAAGVEGSDITMEAAKSLPSEKRGRIKVDKYLRSTEHENVYVIGDNMFYIPDGAEAPVPQMVENCEQSAATAAKNIASAVTGSGEMREYKPTFHGVMVSIGGRYGVGRVGTPKMMFNLPSFLAMFVKHFINIVYFIQILGWNKVASYLKHEFFTIRNCRSFVGGHFSNRTPSFLLVPLRIWLGAAWLFEGVKKIVEGWLSFPKLTGFFGGATDWWNGIINGAAGTAVEAVSSATEQGVEAVSSATEQGAAVAQGVVDAVSSATTDAAASMGMLIFNWDFNLFKAAFVSGKSLADSGISDFAFRFEIPLMDWFVNHLILPHDGVQLFMQCAIVFAEILVGLALMGGLFTFPASAASIVLQAMFMATTGIYLGTFWMIFAGIAVLIGGGRTFGLDYYVMPYLKKAWKKLPFVRKLYIYND
ncbi:MAG: FAD-dependent oxidoreductase [Spirochaetaceae bacterium]|nr:FAD-dependent oxidoreductase [Spirochaetaceae bacterium]